MLTDADKELITTALDGELPPDQEASFRRLMAESPAAAAFYAQLEADARRLRSLPRRSAPATIAAAVAAQIGTLSPVHPRRPGPVPTRRVGWLPYATAASVLLAVAAGSFWVSFHETATEAERRALRDRLPLTGDPTTPSAAQQSPAIPVESMPERLPRPRSGSETASPSSEEGFAIRPTPLVPEVAPSPRPSGVGDVVGSRPLAEPKALEGVQARVPFLAPLTELDREEQRRRLVEELSHDPAYRLDLFVRDVPRTAELLQSAGKPLGLTIAVDAQTQDRLRKKHPIAVAVYTEVLTAEEIVRLLGQVATQLRASDPSGGAGGIAHLVPAGTAEARDLRDLLGIDPGLWKRPANTPRPISAGTVGQLTASLDKGSARPAILLTYLPASLRTPASTSKEVKAYLERRGDRKPTAIPLLVLLRPAS